MPAKNKGFSLVEILVVTFILVIVITALLITLNTGDLTNKIGSARLEVQQEVRRAMDWMVRDLRQTNRVKLEVLDQLGTRKQFNLLANGETFSEPLFNICTDYIDLSVQWSANQIGYAFDNINKTITRTDYGTTQVWQFNNIDSLTFKKISLNLLRITVSGKKTARGSIEPTFALEEEVKLRNE